MCFAILRPIAIGRDGACCYAKTIFARQPIGVPRNNVQGRAYILIRNYVSCFETAWRTPPINFISRCSGHGHSKNQFDSYLIGAYLTEVALRDHKAVGVSGARFQLSHNWYALP